MDVHRIPQPPTVIPLRRDQPHPRDDGSGLRFGRFRLLPAARLLLRDHREVELGGRAFELLQVFLTAPGVVLSKAEIMGRVWPDTQVEEGNLRFQVCCLRRALGPDGALIRTVAGRGYVFAGKVDGSGSPRAAGDVREVADEGSDPNTAAALAQALEAVEQLRCKLDVALDRLVG